ncbi:UDP-N-acetylmuramoyl-L-alanyl-D-glutamate--2,6-diaminopimelate ligase [Mobilitalea sibirica]|uniref:UDP-N-acetylmuramoyl-L-alanyl-D-glutamate--2,6-diaminopimelate ligase n=1 Tax=Mobilitalea sibirica TaxID=1462919 RepID=A0A8J7HA85_9FIRM|nr:UDP-N-acetylmuramoyl-L-alanyl-D-glutamate--2,6-diaminopimelate ligase [Mobilitalea sibirica]MBH1941345.1 UDP-N-acetylmuramoyl-L-alanyl-D-glutamate--2,6-diaminopimelate ligase [Mobilitalea sibirica]
MQLDQLLEKLDYTCIQGDVHTLVTELVYDTRKSLIKDCVFVCISGAKHDGHDYIDEVVKNGAAAIVVEKDVVLPKDVTVIRVESTREALAVMSAAYFGHPANKMITIGITGTKGKTTTTYMVKSILEKVGIKTGLIGTIENIIGDDVIPASHSTPESFIVQQTFAKMVEAGCECVVMEVSSQGLKHSRVSGFTFDYGIFTNIEPDHIGGDEHKDFEEYLECKSKLFKQCKIGLINRDDSHFEEILKGHTCEVETFGFSDQADIQAKEVRLLNKQGYLGIAYRVEGLMNFDVELNIPGKFNAYNSLCAIALCSHFNVSVDKIKQALDTVRVRGRVELVPVSDKFSVMLDYAHNAMSLESLLTTLKEYQPKRLVCVFGCGGNRSRDRRFEMGEISSRLADLTIVTSDNPRFEEPQDIINDIIVGVKKGPGQYVEIIDRKEAIRYSIEHALEGDVIVIAGKGHEDYQEIKGVKYHMDDRELIRDAAEGL